MLPICDREDQLGDALEKAEAENARLRAALEPFALIALDVLKNHPGWANSEFVAEWASYRITYTQFERAGAAAIRAYQQQPPRSWTEAKNEVASGWPDE